MRAARKLDIESGNLDGPASETRCRVTVAERRAAVSQEPEKAMDTRWCVPLKSPLATRRLAGQPEEENDVEDESG